MAKNLTCGIQCLWFTHKCHKLSIHGLLELKQVLKHQSVYIREQFIVKQTMQIYRIWSCWILCFKIKAQLKKMVFYNTKNVDLAAIRRSINSLNKTVKKKTKKSRRKTKGAGKRKKTGSSKRRTKRKWYKKNVIDFIC